MISFKLFFVALIALIGGVLVSGIDRSDVISNANSWLNPPVPYSQTAYKDGYRTDCSGYVSMAWGLSSNKNTRTLLQITTSISRDDLKAGDILLKPGSHVMIFSHWDSARQGRYIGYEQVGGSRPRNGETKKRSIPYPYYNGGAGYSPRRYNDIED